MLSHDCDMQIKAGQWEGGHSKNATQYYNVVGYLTHKWIGAFVLFITIISLCSTGIAQIVAISTGLYYLDTSISKRWVSCCNDGHAAHQDCHFVSTVLHYMTPASARGQIAAIHHASHQHCQSVHVCKTCYNCVLGFSDTHVGVHLCNFPLQLCASYTFHVKKPASLLLDC